MLEYFWNVDIHYCWHRSVLGAFMEKIVTPAVLFGDCALYEVLVSTVSCIEVASAFYKC